MPIFTELDKIDSTIAAAYKAVTKDDPTATIDKAGAQRIFDPVFAGNKITEKQAKALVLILKTHEKTIAKEARDYLLRRALEPTFEANLGLGLSRSLTTDKELEDVTKPLDQIANSIVFKSIGTKGAGSKQMYGPHHYQAIRQLVSEREIAVHRVADAGLQIKLSGAIGEYDSDRDNIVLGEGTTKNEEANTVIHEATHAIQDWLDFTTAADKYLEADAYVAAAVVDLLLGTKRDAKGKHPIDVAWHTAAPLVKDGTARTEKPAWLKAYDAVVAAVAAFPGYKARANDVVDLDEPGRKPRRKPKSAPPARTGSEKKNMEEIMAALQKAGAKK